ncbi:MAG: hypothetical protein KDD37_08710, partial [Bdellovibrionales bacterium]|nr:hypothetical protein [Bdellovibrionales bacterium]
LRAFYLKAHAKHFVDLQKFLAKAKKVYRVVENPDLEKLSQSKHHEGVCFIVNPPKSTSLSDWIDSEKKKTDSVLLVLENIGNPHNIGAIIRIAAHFGVSAIASMDVKSLSSGAAIRTAEGGAEVIQNISIQDLKASMLSLKKNGYKVLTTSSHQGSSVYKHIFGGKTVLLFGEEGDGLSKEAFGLQDERIMIPGSGKVESLNVSTAIAIILSERYRQIKR